MLRLRKPIDHVGLLELRPGLGPSHGLVHPGLLVIGCVVDVEFMEQSLLHLGLAALFGSLVHADFACFCWLFVPWLPLIAGFN